MSSDNNPLVAAVKAYDAISKRLQTHLSSLFDSPRRDSTPNLTLQSPLPQPPTPTSVQVTKEAVGNATWTFLHSVAAQFPDQPTRQQKRDVKELMGIISRVYPCKECADHFKEILKANPVQAGSQDEFSQWLCHVHNVVNRSLGKTIFPCQRVNARWGKLDCADRACDLEGGSDFGDL